jgi:hypothetical protein
MLDLGLFIIIAGALLYWLTNTHSRRFTVSNASWLYEKGASRLGSALIGLYSLRSLFVLAVF